MKKAIIEKFIELLNTMKYEDISVSLLCEKCSTSRTTFYKYFDNIDEVFIEIENELLSDMVKLYKENNNIRNINDNAKLSNLYEMYKYIYDHKKIFSFFFSDNCPKTYMDRAIKYVMDKLYIDFRKYLNDEQAKEACAVCVNFIMVMAKSLVVDEYSLSPKQLSILFRNLVLHLIKNTDVYFG